VALIDCVSGISPLTAGFDLDLVGRWLLRDAADCSSVVGSWAFVPQIVAPRTRPRALDNGILDIWNESVPKIIINDTTKLF